MVDSAATDVVPQVGLLDGDPDGWPDKLFVVEGERLYEQRDSYPSKTR